ncbi:sensor histidine kinase [Lientehia hominis]|uniref:sensor histidine kinase n=1 Tax=Lientehia hominis TaxID=2897778 RepID=UPI0038CC109B
MKNNKKNLSGGLAGRLFLRMIIALFSYTVLGIIGYFLAINIFSFRTWSGDELLYRIARWFDMRRDLFALAYIVIGYIGIFLYYWRKPFSYFQEVADAAEVIYKQDDSMVSLSAPLKDLENQMNQIKVSVLNNERIAREAEQRKNDLVTYLAHDLKTPITSVIGYLTLLKDEPQISEEMRNRYISIAREKAERLDDLINEFFDITRFNLSHITLEKSEVHLIRMLNQLIYEFKPMLREKNLNCVLQSPEDLRIYCDPDKLQRVFDNLLRNAVNYSHEDCTIRIRVEEMPNQVKLSFINDGDQISEEKLKRIFEQFYRLDNSRSTKSGGAGLGLAIAKEIVELHGGQISAYSEDNIIRFDVTLPRL